MRNASFVADLKCTGCGRTLVGDGCLKCTRCDALVPATLGKKRIYCPNCSSPRVLLARHDEAMCPESKSRCQNRRDNKGTPMKLTSSEEAQMIQQAVVAEEKKHSKTQELRDWLDGEIKRVKDDVAELDNAFNTSIGRSVGGRYYNLLSDERETKMAEDRGELEELRERLELLRSATELDIDIEAVEKTGIVIEVDKDTLKWYFRTYYAADGPMFLFDFSVTERTVRSYNLGESPLCFSLVHRNVKKIRAKRENGYVSLEFNPGEKDKYLAMTAYEAGYRIFSLK